jgi:hypothetical protein
MISMNSIFSSLDKRINLRDFHGKYLLQSGRKNISEGFPWIASSLPLDRRKYLKGPQKVLTSLRDRRINLENFQVEYFSYFVNKINSDGFPLNLSPSLWRDE